MERKCQQIASKLYRVIQIALSILITASGPVGTYYILTQIYSDSLDIIGLIAVGIGTSISILVTVRTYENHGCTNESIKKSIIQSEKVYFLLLACVSLTGVAFFNKGQDVSEIIGWLPLALFFCMLYLLPMAIAISYGVMKLIALYEKKI